MLDGASQLRPLKRSGGWIANQLGRRLAYLLEASPLRPLDEVLDEAVRSVIRTFDLRPGLAPSTTVNIVRSRGDVLDVLVLCDSPVIVLGMDGTIRELRDDRLDLTGQRVKDSLAGVIPTIDDINNRFEPLRNHPDGFWCVSAHPDVAQHAYQWQFPAEEVFCAFAMTDGVSTGVDYYGTPDSWRKACGIALDNPMGLIEVVQRTEIEDQACERWPRFKVHDDKALALFELQPLANPSLQYCGQSTAAGQSSGGL